MNGILKNSSFVVIILVFGLIACEGPAGPIGPQGPKGPKGDNGITQLILIEEYLDDEDRNNDDDSYYLRDSRIKLLTVVEIYVKLFYTNTGGTYYMTFTEWAEREGYSGIEYQIMNNGNIRFWDPNRRLEFRTVVIAVTGQ